MPTKQEIIDQLKEINYPGFNRDIISFGVVNNIEITDKEIKDEYQNDGWNVADQFNVGSSNEPLEQTLAQAKKSHYSTEKSCNQGSPDAQTDGIVEANQDQI